MTDYYRNIERVPEKDVAELVGRVVRLESLERGVSVLRNNVKTVLETILVASLFLLVAVCLTVGGLFTIRATRGGSSSRSGIHLARPGLVCFDSCGLKVCCVLVPEARWAWSSP